jgi:hypothetical protein
MPKHRQKRRPPKRSLALPGLEQTKSALLNSLTSKNGQRSARCAQKHPGEIVSEKVYPWLLHLFPADF